MPSLCLKFQLTGHHLMEALLDTTPRPVSSYLLPELTYCTCKQVHSLCPQRQGLYLLWPLLYAQHSGHGLAHRSGNCKEDGGDDNNNIGCCYCYSINWH